MQAADKNHQKDLKEETVNISIEHVKELEAELLKLRIENAFLKELRRLRLEDEAKMRDLHGSSTVSEDSLN
jgi:transposase